ncbi:Roadblock/LAMTOR2 domain-containing protein [Madurella fahalii]|uniref:Roadblock/LAMTOR2 domain-containing protein n=1 Tax=Madurella fahalii TaxID=1157608 RepID=A0ABQ0GE63_9PEZI
MSRVMPMPPPPPLLLTKRVTSFLRANLSPYIHAAMLTTPAGNLLAHASNLPASALRRQCAVAASLWALQGPASTSGPTAAGGDPGPSSPGAAATIPSGSTITTKKTSKHSPPAVTVQLDSGAVFVIRRLRCGMLFICMGGTEGAAPGGGRTATHAHQHHNHRHQQQHALNANAGAGAGSASAIASGTATPTRRPTTPTMQAQNNGHAPTDAETNDLSPTALPPLSPSVTTSNHQPPAPPPPSSSSTRPTTPRLHSQSQTAAAAAATTPPPLGSPSESASILTTHTTHTTGGVSTASAATTATISGSSVLAMRRQVEELARWLDDKLAGLCVPEEGIGIGIGIGTGIWSGAGSSSSNSMGDGVGMEGR